ncbi:D-glycero-beta-D-manno-heptose 1,7-bisphosphate 7-phosphatase [Gilvimarinus sp. F26214L]|uniref:D-glycero-beta-D-manno-heptose 1,7-bisphosphate 7-phosphatase n=1 Tax=Gilvimarinus sp. DZF01 TaxID=3461371 RepID=UPI0040457BFC
MSLVIIDRDGVINYDSDHYVKSAAEFQPIPGSLEAIAKLSQAGFTVAVATNQSGLGRGLFELEDLEAMHEKLTMLLHGLGGELGGIFYCPHLPDDDCDCRKPRSGLITAIEAELGMSARGAPLVGDSQRDLEAALSKGCDPILVRTGKGSKTLRNMPESLRQRVKILDDLSAAADYILEHYSP